MDTVKKTELNTIRPDIIWADRKRWFCGLPWTFTKYSLSKDRLFIEKGLFNYEQNETRLYRILDIQLKINLIQRIFGLGTIKVCSSDKTLGNFELKNIRNCSDVKELLSVNVEKQRIKNRVSSRELMGNNYNEDDSTEIEGG